MQQEQRFVAEVFRYLASLIDTQRPIFLSLDGQAAKGGVKEKYFPDPDVPDLWFTLVGESKETLIEAKVCNGRAITLGAKQLSAWRSQGGGGHRPEAWIAANGGFDRFYFWTHRDFLPALDRCKNRQPYPKLRMPKQAVEFLSVQLLALHILRAMQSKANNS